ncbi:MAG: hypothetical protein ABIZ80_14595 [Bryobacteraceae bacterium]
MPGSDIRGVANSFGAVFANVAIAHTTLIEYLSPEGVSLGRYYARTSPKGLSFGGVSGQDDFIECG